MPLQASLAALTQADINLLVSTGAQEGQRLDFKRELPAQWNDSAKSKLLSDVTAFANSAGGDVVFGIDEDSEARASRIVPQVLSNPDECVRTVQQIAIDLTEPRVPGLEVQAVPVTVGDVSGYVVVLRIPQSWAAPHRSRMGNHFHVREGVRNRTLDVPEVRAQFLRSESLGQKLRDFRSERLAKLVSGQAPVALDARPKLVVHAIPTQAAAGQVEVNPVPYLRREKSLPMLGPKSTSASAISINFDGALGALGYSAKPVGYTQQFRPGYFEAAWELSPLEGDIQSGLPSAAYEEYVLNFLDGVRRQLAAHAISLEVVVFVSLLGADQTIFVPPASLIWGPEKKTFDRRDILLPEVVIPADVNVGVGMRPIYDRMCQAAGEEGSAGYSEDGEWRARR